MTHPIFRTLQVNKNNNNGEARERKERGVEKKATLGRTNRLAKDGTRACGCGCRERFVPVRSDQMYLNKRHKNRVMQRRRQARGKLGTVEQRN
jgi:hypothetical protein